MSTLIHPTAIIEKGANIGNEVTIEPYAVIKSSATLHDRVVIKAHAYIDGNTTIGEGTVIYPLTSIGTKPQDLKYRGEKTYVQIGKNCEIREFVTINASCQENSVVSIGDNCLIMASCHIAHNCRLGDRVIMSNNTALAGHVTVEDFAILGGLTGVHQYVRIGTHAMVGGMSRITHDIPPYTIGAGMPFKFGGLNLVGLKRHGFTLKVRRELHKAYKLLYRSSLSFASALACIEQQVELIPEVIHWLKFCRDSKRGLMGLQEALLDSSFEESIEEPQEESQDAVEEELAGMGRR